MTSGPLNCIGSQQTMAKTHLSKVCDKLFSTKSSLNRHKEIKHKKNKRLYKCAQYSHTTKRLADLTRHYEKIHKPKITGPVQYTGTLTQRRILMSNNQSAYRKEVQLYNAMWKPRPDTATTTETNQKDQAAEQSVPRSPLPSCMEGTPSSTRRREEDMVKYDEAATKLEALITEEDTAATILLDKTTDLNKIREMTGTPNMRELKKNTGIYRRNTHGKSTT